MANRAIYEALSLGKIACITEQDTLDIASGTVPTSLRAYGVHYSTAGKKMAALYIRRHLRGKGL